MEINEYAPERAAKLKRWKRNRDHTSGGDVVKAGAYLPRDPDMKNAAYANFCRATPYFPAAARTLETFTGLIFRKSPKVVAADAVEALTTVLTPTGDTLEHLAKWAFREFCVANDGGLLIDHPDAPQGLTKAQATALDIRPYVAPYAAESILETQFGVIMGRKRLIKVRLLDSDSQVRVLELIDNTYTVTIFQKLDSQWINTGTTTPLMNGQPINAIPFVHLGDGADCAHFDGLCSKNEEHFIVRSNLTEAIGWISKPVLISKGINEDVELTVKAGMHWRLEGDTAEVKWNEYSGDGVPAIERELDRIAKELEILGSRMLASEKASTASEAAETVARRNAGEESILGSFATHIGNKLTEALQWVARWFGSAEPASVRLNTDFVPTPISPAMLAQITSLKASGLLPLNAIFDLLVSGEMLDPARWDYETWAAALDTEL